MSPFLSAWALRSAKMSSCRRIAEAPSMAYSCAMLARSLMDFRFISVRFIRLELLAISGFAGGGELAKFDRRSRMRRCECEGHWGGGGGRAGSRAGGVVPGVHADDGVGAGAGGMGEERARRLGARRGRGGRDGRGAPGRLAAQGSARRARRRRRRRRRGADRRG